LTLLEWWLIVILGLGIPYELAAGDQLITQHIPELVPLGLEIELVLFD